MRALQAEGVKTIFGYPGGSIMPTYDALFDYTRGEKKCFDHILAQRAMHVSAVRLALLLSPVVQAQRIHLLVWPMPCWTLRPS